MLEINRILLYNKNIIKAGVIPTPGDIKALQSEQLLLHKLAHTLHSLDMYLKKNKNVGFVAQVHFNLR